MKPETVSVKHPKHRGEQLAPYPITIRFLKGLAEWTEAEKIGSGPPDPKTYAATLLSRDSRGHSVLWFYVSDAALRGQNPAATIAHEAAHGATYVADRCGFDPGVGRSSEPFAYLLDDIVTRAMDYYGVTSSVKRRSGGQRRSKK